MTIFRPNCAPRRLLHSVLIAGGALLAAATLRAHDPGLSTLHLVARDGAVEFVLQFAPGDAAYVAPLDGDGDGRVTRAEFEAARPALGQTVARWAALRPASSPFQPMSAQFEERDNNVLFRALLPEAPAGAWTLFLPRLIELPPGHRQLVTVVGRSGAVIAEQMLDASQPWLAFSWSAAPLAHAGATAPAPAPSTFTAFLKLGVEHILLGFDHLLFLAGLLLVCRRLAEMAAIVTSFTLAHSFTLVLATFDLVSLPGRLVEPLIAASIIYVGVENLLRRGKPPRARWALTFAFGLIHGLGFAGVLRELGVGEAGRAALGPLVGFNLGVEAGQLAVAAVLLPALLFARRRPWFERRALPALSGLVSLVGLFWLIERVR